MGKLIFITGGANSGKTTFAQNLAAQYDDVALIATSDTADDASGAVYHANDGLGNIIMLNRHSFFIVDSVGKMVLKVIEKAEGLDDAALTRAAEQAQEQMDSIIAAACASDTVVAVITEEAGMGVVPDAGAAQAFCDILGRVNRQLTQFADEAYMMVSGLTLRLK